MTCKGEVKGSDYRWFGIDSHVCVVIRGVY